MPQIDKQEQASSPDSEDSKALRRRDLEGVNIHVCTLCASGTEVPQPQVAWGSGTGPMGLPRASVYQPPAKTVYSDIYVHSKLLLVDDVFFTLGSANVNVRSMEVDSELNIAMPSPELTRQWRRDLWKIHTGRVPGDDAKDEFRTWQQIMADNGTARRNLQPMVAPLVEFYDDAKSGSRTD